MTTNKTNQNLTKAPGQIRIIGGQWRGRFLQVPAAAAVRPTPNRVRETLFNWLAPVIRHSRCLDLFAGTGALGVEALSRGAQFVAFVDADKKLLNAIEQQLKVFQKTENISMLAQFYCWHVPQNKITELTPFSIVFLDPPFFQNLIEKVSVWLEEKNLLTPNGLIYLETESTLQPIPVPSNWQLIHCKRASQVQYCLFKRGN